MLGELGKKSESQMGFEPTTLRDLVGCSNHWATENSMVSKGQFITRLHSQVMTSTHELTNSITLQPINLQSEYIKDETTTRKSPSPRGDLNPRPSVI